jgi:uncharacterized membrane protein YhiD involved in acid resistance
MDGQSITLTAPLAALSPETVALNLALAGLLAFILSLHFIHFGATFSNRAKFARVLPAIALTTTLVISVVKASLALSLGLVGALSIVRFRTPVKEPEELAYLFVAIAIGLGMGADQRVVTTIAIGLILLILAIRALLSRGSRYPNLYLNIEVPQGQDRPGLLQEIIEVLLACVPSVDMRRFDVEKGALQATFYLECKDSATLVAVQKELTQRYPESTISFVEQSAMPGV